MTNSNIEKLAQRIILESNSETLTHTRGEELLLREYILLRDPRAIDYGMWRFSETHAGLMHRDPRINQIYMAVGATSLLTRYAIDGGMPEARAYAISDMFLQRLDIAFSQEQTIEWYRKVLTMFVALMPPKMEGIGVIQGKTYSKVVTKAIEYCMNNITESLFLKDVCGALFVNANYLSTRFKKETGISFSRFVNHLKIETAKELMRNTKYTVGEIAHTLSFNSQSYFIKMFKDETGITPKEYILSLAADVINKCEVE